MLGLDGTTALEGTWTWKNDHEMTEIGDFKETAIFIPTDTNYAPTFGGSDIQSVSVTGNDKLTASAEPKKDGYTFDDWYMDKEAYMD